MQHLNAVSIMVPWHNTFFWCEFMRLDQSHSREKAGGLTMCRKMGWTSGWFKILYISKGNMVSGIAMCRFPFAQDQAPCFTPPHSNPALVTQKNACLLCRPFATSGILWFCFTFWDLIFLGTQLTLGCCPTQLHPAPLSPYRPKHQVCPILTTSLVPIFGYQEASQYSSQQNLLLQAPPLALPSLSPSASSLHGPHPAVCHPLQRAKPSRCAKCPAVTAQALIRVWPVQMQALVALFRKKAKRSWMRCLLWGSSEYLQEAVALGHIWLF